MRLAALQRCRPLAGTEMMTSWRARADTFPRKLVSALVEQALAPEVLTSWSAREALVSRGDDLATAIDNHHHPAIASGGSLRERPEESGCSP
jgi:hypothetical protein